MGIGPFHRSCFTASANPQATAPNPDPSRWVLLKHKAYARSYVVMVQYKDCTNFEGKKVMVYFGRWPGVGRFIRKGRPLDPHFSEEPESPIARFQPTEFGWDMACAVAKGMSGEDKA